MSTQLPKDWSIIELKDLIDKKRSIRYGIVQPGDYDENGRYMVRGQDYSFGWLGPENLFKVSDAIEGKYKNARLKTGDIILTIVGAGTGTVAIVPEWLNGANCTQTTARIAVDPTKADSLYCYYYLSSDKGKKLTYQNIKGGAQPGLNCGDIEYFEIILPPIPEQKAIAKVLSTADAAIYTTEKLIAQKELRKKWLMQQLLTGKKRLKGFDGNWFNLEISHLFVLRDRYVNWSDSENYKLISIRRRNGGAFYRESLYGYQIGVKKLKVVKVNDFLISKRQASHGAWTVIQNEHDNAKVSDEYDCLEISDRNQLNPDFWKWYCQIPLLTHFANVDSDGVHIEKSIFDYNLFKRRKISIPTSINEQNAISSILQASDNEISLLKAKAAKLREQKKGLMQVLLTGKVRLKI